MANRKERHRIWLKCDDCESEFQGDVTYTFIKLGEESGMERQMLNRIYARCPRGPSHMNIRPRDA